MVSGLGHFCFESQELIVFSWQSNAVSLEALIDIAENDMYLNHILNDKRRGFMPSICRVASDFMSGNAQHSHQSRGKPPILLKCRGKAKGVCFWRQINMTIPVEIPPPPIVAEMFGDMREYLVGRASGLAEIAVFTQESTQLRIVYSYAKRCFIITGTCRGLVRGDTECSDSVKRTHNSLPVIQSHFEGDTISALFDMSIRPQKAKEVGDIGTGNVVEHVYSDPSVVSVIFGSPQTSDLRLHARVQMYTKSFVGTSLYLEGGDAKLFRTVMGASTGVVFSDESFFGWGDVASHGWFCWFIYTCHAFVLRKGTL